MSQVETNKDKRPPRLTGEANVFGNRLTELKEEHKYSFADIADMLNKSKTTIIGYSHGYRFPLMREIEKLAKLFNTSVAYLIGETDIKGPPITKQTLAEMIKYRDFKRGKVVLEQEELDLLIDHMEKMNMAADKELEEKEEKEEKKA